MLALALMMVPIPPTPTPQEIADRRQGQFISCAYDKSRELLVLKETAEAVARASVSLCEREFLDMREAMRNTYRVYAADGEVVDLSHADATAARARQQTLEYVEGEVMSFRASYRRKYGATGKLPWE